MRIVSGNQSVHIDKPDGTSVDYYMLPEYEVHINSVAPGTKQVWHRHTKVEEVIFIIEGELAALWIDDSGIERESLLHANDMILVQRSFHTFENRSGKPCKFIVIKLVLNGTDNSQIFKTDKVLQQDGE